MTLRIGPLSGLRTHGTWSMEGDRLRISAWCIETTLAKAQAKREALVSLPLHGDPVIPITSTEDVAMSSYYQLVRVSIDVEPGTWDTQFAFKYSLEANRLDHGQSALLRLRSNGLERSGYSGGTGVDYNISLPSTLTGCDLDGASDVFYTVTGPGGSCRKYVASILSDRAIEAQLDHDSFYDMSPVLTMNGETVIGRWAPARNYMSSWLLNNGLIKVAAPAATTHTFQLTQPNPGTPANWGAVTYQIAVEIELGGAMVVLTPTSLRVLEMTCERAHIQLIGWPSTAATNDDYKYTVDLILRRGSSFVELQTSSNVSAKHQIRDIANPGYTSVLANRSMERTSNDADGNKLFVTGDVATTITGASSRNTTSSATNAVGWAVGGVLNGSSAVAPHRYSDQVDFFWADQTITVEVS